MEIRDQVCSLELAKRLKELGVKQESLFWWGKPAHLPPEWRVFYVLPPDGEEFFSAFNVAELGEMLPYPIVTKLYSDGSCPHGRWLCFDPSDKYPRNKPPESCSFGAESEADARCKMLIYLLEQGLVKL